MQVNTTQTVIHDLGDVSPGRYLLWIKNTGTNPLTAFSLQGRNSSSGLWVDIVTDFLTASTFLQMTSDTVNPVTLAAGAEWNGAILNNTFKSMRIVAAGDTTVELEVSFAGSV